MSTGELVELSSLMASSNGSITPSKFPDEVFDLYSIPAFDRGAPELVPGSEIGSPKQIVQEGDVLLSKIVPHIRRSWIVGPHRGKRLVGSGEWIVFRAPTMYGPYLRHFLLSDGFHAQFMNTVAGVGGSLLRARPMFVAKLHIPLPSMTEQRRIAGMLDEANALQAQRRRALSQLDELAQSSFLDMFGHPLANPRQWLVSTLGQVAEQVTDGEHLTPQREVHGIKLLSARNVRDGHIDFENTDFIGPDEYARIRRRCDPRRGDILISCSGTIGRVAPVETDEQFSLVRSVALVRPVQSMVTTRYLASYLQTPALKRRMLQSAKASSQANLFQGPLKELPVLLPPMEQQQDFGARLVCVDRVRHLQSLHLSETDSLFAALQHQAFHEQL